MDIVPVIESLKSKTIQKWSVWQISRLAGSEAIPVLVAALKAAPPPAPGLVEAVGRCHFESDAAAAEACQVLGDYLGRKGADVRRAVEALVRIAHPTAVPILNRVLLENWPKSDATARMLAIVGLTRAGTASAVHPLLHALGGGVSGSGVFDSCTWNSLARCTDVRLPVSGDGDIDVPTLAAWALGVVRAPEAADPLVAKMNDRIMDKTFLPVAMFALTELADDYAERLRPFLGNLLARARFAALTALARKNPARHAEEFRTALKHDDPWVRLSAARGLHAAGSDEAGPVLLETLDKWTTEPDCKTQLFQLAGEMGLPGVAPLAFKRMTAFTASEQERAAAASVLSAVLSRLSVQETQNLADQNHWKPEDVLGRINTLLQQGIPGSIEAAIKLLRALEGRFGKLLEKGFEGLWFKKARQAAALALVAAGATSDIKPWIARLDHRDTDVAELAFWVLHARRDPACQPRLLEILAYVPETGGLGKLFGVDKTKKPAYVRRKMLACLALAHCGSEAALAPLASLTRDANPDIRAAAGAALAEVGLRHLPASRSAGVPEALMALWQVPSYALRAAIARYLAAAGHAAAAPLLLAELDDSYGGGPFGRYREVLVRALGALGDPSAAAAITRAALADADAGVRQAAGKALQALGLPLTPSWKATAEARRDLLERENAALAREVLAEREDGKRFLELMKAQTTVAAGDPLATTTADQLQIYRSSIPLCCAACLQPAERAQSVSVSESAGNKTITYFVSIPLCSRCSLTSDVIYDFSPVEIRQQEQHWVAKFRNPRFEMMTADRAWLATVTDTCQSIFAEALDEWEEPAGMGAAPATTSAPAAREARPTAASAPAPDRAEVRRAEELFYRGKNAFLLGNWDEAVAALKGAVALAPKSAHSQFLLGASLVQLGRLEEALGPLQIAVELNPLLADAQNALGMTLGKLGRIEEGERHMARAAFLGHPQALEVLQKTGMDYCRACAAPLRRGETCAQCAAATQGAAS